MFGTSGIRGPVGTTVTAKLALRIGRAVANGAETVVVGQDARVTGGLLADAVSVGLRECGADVIRLGVASTPTIARSVDWLDADLGIAVTASHNPAPDNGLKFWNPSGQAFDRAQSRKIVTDVISNAHNVAAWDALGTERTVDDAADRHVAHLVDHFEPMDIPVVIDLGNGTGRVTVDALYELGCTVDTLNAQPDGRFPARRSEPTAETCHRLRETVAGTDAVLGIAHDGDSDRMVAVAEDGTFVPGDALLALFGREAVSPGDRVAVPIDTSLLVSDIVGSVGGEVVYTPVGDVHIAARATEPDVVFGGEPSGAWIWPDETLCPDGHYAACKLATLVAHEGSLSGLLKGFDGYSTKRENVRLENPDHVMDGVIGRVLTEYDDVTPTDGVRVDTDDGWFLVRASGTEPLIRLTAEARDGERATELLDEARSLVTSTRVRV